MHGPICSYCGQERARKIETKRVARELWSQFLELDFLLVRSLIELILHPSQLITHYIAGKRVLYTNPFKLLFITATAYYLMVLVLDLQVGVGFGEQKEQADKAGKVIGAILNYLVFIFLIPTAWMFKKLYAKQRFNFAECYVVLCFIWSGYLIIGIPTAITVYLTDINLFLLRSLVAVIYITLVTKYLFELRTYIAIVKGVLFYLGYLISTFLIMSLLVIGAYLFQFEPLMLGPK